MNAHRPTLVRPLAALFCALLAVAGHTAQTDISDTPLASQQSDQVKPNILFILDDSGSMNWDYMPDNVSTSTLGYRSNICNYVAYHPGTVYTIPAGYNGTLLNNSNQTTFTSALNDGYYSYDGAGSSTTNLTGRYYWAFNSSSATSNTTVVPVTSICTVNNSTTYTANTSPTTSRTITDSAVTGICYATRGDNNYNGTIQANGQQSANGPNPASLSVSTPAACPNGQTLVWSKVVVSSTSGTNSSDERQNYANWYSYYRQRIMMMKAASSRAFAPISDNYRLGFMTIHPGTFDSTGNASNSNVLSSKFLKINDFNSTQRQSWFNTLFLQTTTGSTPTRTALSVAGRYFAGKNDLVNQGMIPTTADDPVQYSCQQNFSILTTDGYWNDGDSRALDGVTVLPNQDGNISELDAYNPASQKIQISPPPMYDGATALYVYNTASNAYQNASCVYSSQAQASTVQYQRCTTPQLQTRTRSNSSSPWSAWSNTSSCTPSSKKQCQYVCSGNTWTNAQCTNTDITTLPLCQSVSGAWTNVASCTATSQNSSGVATACQTLTVNGYKIQYRSTTTATTYPGPGQSGSIIGSPQTSTSPWTDLDGTCYPTAPTLPANGAVTGNGPPTAPANCTSGNQTWPCETTSSTGGSSNSLADVAQYYYKTDLRPGNTSVAQTSPLYGTCPGGGALGGTIDVCANNVSTSGSGVEDDRANWQHMTTFTMGLGLSGTLPFSPTYKTDTTGTFDSIRKGNTNWPVPVHDDPTALDDLWHAAVDGRGLYFSAGNPDTVITGLTKALSGITARIASAAAAATSNMEPVDGDNFAYTAQYQTQSWVGDLQAHQIDLTSGSIGADTIWSAQAKLDAMTKAGCDNRTIKLFRAGATNNLVDFQWNSYLCDNNGVPSGPALTTLNATEQSYFGSAQVQQFSQYLNMGDGTNGTADQRTPAAGANLVNYLRGQRGKEGFTSIPLTNTDANKLYRARLHVLGDIVDAQPVFIHAPFSQYTDAGYSAFKTAQANRQAMVYVAANDGMLHAINSGSSITDPAGGQEVWAFMPDMVLPNLFKLASENYANNHQFYVDGTPTAADVFDTTCGQNNPSNLGSCWKTILVGGMNKGGKGYYALDVSDPNTPKALWEFQWSSTCYDGTTATAGSDCHLGYTYGRPVVAKLADGTWAVFVTSGYNNDDGKGYLYVLNATTGKIIYRIGTGAGSSTTPSGLNQLAAWVDNATQDNTAQRIYGVDLLGNVWRFDINDTIAPSGREAQLVTQVVDSNGTPQPITTHPRIAEIGSDPFVYVATGRYLGVTDKADTHQQTIWAIKDPMTATVTAPRTTLSPRTLTDVGSGNTATRTITAASCTSGNGWYIDLPDSGERVNIDMQLQLGTLVASSNVPSPNACSVGGYSWLNYVNAKTGCQVTGSSIAGNLLVSSSGVQALVVGINVIRLPSGQVKIISTDSSGGHTTSPGAFDQPGPEGRRITWREIVQ